MAYPNNTQSISFGQLNVELGHSATAQLSLGQAGLEEFGRAIGNEISICEFYSNGCPNDYQYPWDTDSYQSDIIGEVVTTTWEHAGALQFTLASYTVWERVNSGNFTVRQSGISSSATSWSDTNTQPGFNIYTRVQAIGTGGQKSPLDADMTNSTLTPLPIYPPFAKTTTEDNTPTTQ